MNKVLILLTLFMLISPVSAISIREDMQSVMLSMGVMSLIIIGILVMLYNDVLFGAGITAIGLIMFAFWRGWI